MRICCSAGRSGRPVACGCEARHLVHAFGVVAGEDVHGAGVIALRQLIVQIPRRYDGLGEYQQLFGVDARRGYETFDGVDLGVIDRRQVFDAVVDGLQRGAVGVQVVQPFAGAEVGDIICCPLLGSP